MTPPPSGDYLLLIDASSFIHRAYHAMPKLLRRKDNLETGALYGFSNTLLKMLRLNWTSIKSLPRYAAVICDVRGKNWRHELYPAYKAQRKPYEQELVDQLTWIPTIAEAFNVPVIGLQGFEADDIIATYVDKSISEGIDVVVASSDKDLSALYGTFDINDLQVRALGYDSMKDKGLEGTAGSIVGDEEVREKFGVWPAQISDFLALTGDVADNIPGVPGFGPKTVARLLNEFETLPNLMEAAEWTPEKFKYPKEVTKILENNRLIHLSRQLVELRNDVPVDLEIDDLYVKPAPAHVLRGLFMDLEFQSLVEKVDRPIRL